ncbi:S1C family serine protease [Lacticaseibacillus thailandensis]|uniref:Trypsin-like serine protease n=1 Tax=Lacticaseibacillus thailandensis DSM 22698 = JCM 13996 TaxID=1423810 RepID=A0A0R2C799_9LACO|nr:trypsin-like peptidase domain-containing protein [Lacticaseibacillus thailandensis]KRM87200.1 trypsin-like serine protease [Lacticaseibacillus thailandensis DSM 22698 = JCM 13996]
MDKQNNGVQPEANTRPKGNSLGKTATIVVVAALIGGGAGGGLAYYGFSRMSADNMGVTSKSGTAGTTAVTKTKTTSSASQAAFKKVKGAVVSVINLQKESSSTDSDNGWGELFGETSSSSSNSQSSTLTEYSEGSGVIYQKKDGYAYIVTNNHVVSGSDKLEVILSDGTKLTATKVGTDSVTDLAVLKINGSKVKSVASFGNSNKISAGQTVLAVGSPLGTQYATSVTQGIVSAKKRTVDVTDESGNTTNEATVIQTDAAINNGNSGGPLINLSGQVIGITSMKLSGSSSSSSDSATIEGMGFAIPSDEVVSIINQLVKNGKVVRPALGISVVSLSDISSDQQSELLNTPRSLKSGVVVAGFTSSSIAKNAGLSKYDVIVGLDNTKITDVADLHTALYKHKIGDTVKITYYHGSTKKTVSLKLTQTDASLSTSTSSSK